MRSALTCSLLGIVLCLASACASKPEPVKTDDGFLEATIAVPQGMDINDVKKCVGDAFFARHFQNIDVADNKISGTYGGNNGYQGLKLTAIYSTAEIKLYGKYAGKIPWTGTLYRTDIPYTQGKYKRWVENVKKDMTVFLGRKSKGL